MSASPEIAAAFETWKLAELATHYAMPCPDDVMDSLTDREGEAFRQLQQLSAANAEDVVLKLFAMMLREREPGRGEPPMIPSGLDSMGCGQLIADFSTVSLQLREAVHAPHRLAQGGDGK